MSIETNQHPLNNNNIDKCIMCSVETSHTRQDHVDTRLTYVEGAGQLCGHCYTNLFFK